MALEDGPAIEAAAVRLLAAREHSRHELARKLQARFGPGEVLEMVLDGLERQALVSDARFVEQYVGQRVRRGFGPLRIRAELAERGVDPAHVATQLDDGDWDWPALLDEAARRKFGDQAPGDRRELGRRARFLEQRGFPADLVWRYIDANSAG